ncbi:hypothetical protein CH378_11140 [Leptospira kmetyi]|uniref:Uncharacterized protein n=1 Tax=Leptospira kmetyi TaxID=408139 RepID=A0ABX4N8J5_9LEPT|nr:hypothetical protein CH378_11140 [Leptospira kmetyi]
MKTRTQYLVRVFYFKTIVASLRFSKEHKTHILRLRIRLFVCSHETAEIPAAATDCFFIYA